MQKMSRFSCIQKLTVGTTVLLKNSRRETKKGDKMQPRWLGPYIIHADLGKGVYKITNPETGKVLQTAVNQCRLKHYIESPNVCVLS